MSSRRRWREPPPGGPVLHRIRGTPSPHRPPLPALVWLVTHGGLGGRGGGVERAGEGAEGGGGERLWSWVAKGAP